MSNIATMEHMEQLLLRIQDSQDIYDFCELLEPFSQEEECFALIKQSTIHAIQTSSLCTDKCARDSFMRKNYGMSIIPDDLLAHVFSFLNVPDNIQSSMTVSKKCKNVVNEKCKTVFSSAIPTWIGDEGPLFVNFYNGEDMVVERFSWNSPESLTYEWFKNHIDLFNGRKCCVVYSLNFPDNDTKVKEFFLNSKALYIPCWLDESPPEPLVFPQTTHLQFNNAETLNQFKPTQFPKVEAIGLLEDWFWDPLSWGVEKVKGLRSNPMSEWFNYPRHMQTLCEFNNIEMLSLTFPLANDNMPRFSIPKCSYLEVKCIEFFNLIDNFDKIGQFIHRIEIGFDIRFFTTCDIVINYYDFFLKASTTICKKTFPNLDELLITVPADSHVECNCYDDLKSLFWANAEMYGASRVICQRRHWEMGALGCVRANHVVVL